MLTEPRFLRKTARYYTKRLLFPFSTFQNSWTDQTYSTPLPLAYHVSYWLNVFFFPVSEAMVETLGVIGKQLMSHFRFPTAMREIHWCSLTEISAVSTFLLLYIYRKSLYREDHQVVTKIELFSTSAIFIRKIGQ
jgi:hypothetical protein